MARYANLPKKAAIQYSIFGVLMGIGFALYVYRIYIYGMNITVIRLATLVFAVCLIWKVLVCQSPMLRAHWILLGSIVLLIWMNTVWYFDLDAYPGLKKEMVSHFINLLTMLVIVLWIRNEQKFIMLVNGYLLGSVVAIIIGYYGLIFMAIPFEDYVRGYGSDYSQSLAYINYDGSLLRLTGPFMDPNFFGVYLVTVIILSAWMYYFKNKNVVYLMIALMSLITLPLTVSRTAMVGLASFFIVCVFWLKKKYRVAMIVSLPLMALLGLFLVYIYSNEALERMLDPQGLADRMVFISPAISVFLEHPFFGAGPAGILDQDTGIATAHLMYVSIFAKFGIFGALVYFGYIFFPLLTVIVSAETFSRAYRFLIISLYSSFFCMYFLYDFLYFLEFQYFVFAIGYSVVCCSFSRSKGSAALEVYGPERSSVQNVFGLGDVQKCAG